MEMSDVQFQKALNRISLIVDGRIDCFNDVHSEKVYSSMTVTPSGILMYMSDVQLLKAAPLISLVVYGRITVFSESHPSNVDSLIVVTPSHARKLMEISDLQ